VRALEEQPARRRPALPRRRTALALACVLLAIAAVGAGLALSGGGQTSSDDSAPPSRELEAVPSPAPTAGDDGGSVPQSGALQPFSQDSVRATLSGGEAVEPASDLPAIDGRATDLSLWMEIRLPGADELSAASAEAVGITRELGGWVAASDIDTEGDEGSAELALRVPVGRVEDAVVRLSELGTVTGQRVATADLQAGIDRRDARIERLERAIRLLELRLESGTLTPEEELRLKLRIERHRNEIADLRRANLGDRREAATSELELVLHTRAPAAAAEKDEGGAAGAAGDALRFLAAAGTIALFLAIVLSPVVLLVVLLWLAFRARSRRLETRLLDRPDPASPAP
jgi:hypothetical protein